MMRRARKVLLLLLLGAIINVAIAWGCALVLPMDATWVIPGYESWQPFKNLGLELPSSVRINQWTRFGSTRLEVAAGDSRGLPRSQPTGVPLEDCPEWSRARVREAVASSGQVLMVMEARGSPFRALWCQPAELNMFARTVDPPVGGIRISDRLAVASDRFTRPTLPMIPILHGFLINTLFYATMIWLVFVAPFALRRRRRKRLGLCPRCAYPIGTSVVCTECGAAIASSARAAAQAQTHR